MLKLFVFICFSSWQKSRIPKTQNWCDGLARNRMREILFRGSVHQIWRHFLCPTDMTELSPTTCACISKALYLIKTRFIDTEDKWIDCNTLYILASNISWHHLSLNASYTQNCLKCFEWIADRGRSTFIKPVLNKVLLDPKYQGQIYCLRMLFTDLEWHAPFQS